MTVTRLRQNSVSPPVLQLNTLTSNLTWSDHVSNITGKARRLIGMTILQVVWSCSPIQTMYC